jgi:hypothetical protein
MADSPTGEEGADASHESCANVEDGLEDEDSGDDQELARYIDSSKAYNWERIFSDSWKMPLKASWDDYWEDDMAMSVKNFLEGSGYGPNYGPPHKPRKRNSLYPHCVRHGRSNSLHSSDWGETSNDSGSDKEEFSDLWNSSRRIEMHRKSCEWHTDDGPACKAANSVR